MPHSRVSGVPSSSGAHNASARRPPNAPCRQWLSPRWIAPLHDVHLRMKLTPSTDAALGSLYVQCNTARSSICELGPSPSNKSTPTTQTRTHTRWGKKTLTVRGNGRIRPLPSSARFCGSRQQLLTTQSVSKSSGRGACSADLAFSLLVLSRLWRPRAPAGHESARQAGGQPASGHERQDGRWCLRNVLKAGTLRPHPPPCQAAAERNSISSDHWPYPCTDLRLEVGEFFVDCLEVALVELCAKQLIDLLHSRAAVMKKGRVPLHADVLSSNGIFRICHDAFDSFGCHLRLQCSQGGIALLERLHYTLLYLGKVDLGEHLL